MFNPECHLLLGIGDATEAVDLRPTGNPWFDLVPQHVLRDQGFERFVVLNGMWAGTNQSTSNPAYSATPATPKFIIDFSTSSAFSSHNLSLNHISW